MRAHESCTELQKVIFVLHLFGPRESPLVISKEGSGVRASSGANVVEELAKAFDRFATFIQFFDFGLTGASTGTLFVVGVPINGPTKIKNGRPKNGTAFIFTAKFAFLWRRLSVEMTS